MIYIMMCVQLMTNKAMAICCLFVSSCIQSARFCHYCFYAAVHSLGSAQGSGADPCALRPHADAGRLVAVCLRPPEADRLCRVRWPCKVEAKSVLVKVPVGGL